MITKNSRIFLGRKTIRIIALGTFCGLLSSCTTSQFFPNTKKTLPELVVPYNIPRVPEAETVQVARKRFVQKNYPEALLYYEEALKLFPDNGEILIEYAASADMSGKFTLSDRAYRRYEKNFGRNFQYFNNYGYSMILRGNYKKAKKYLLEALRFEPSSIVVRNNLILLDKVSKI